MYVWLALTYVGTTGSQSAPYSSLSSAVIRLYVYTQVAKIKDDFTSQKYVSELHATLTSASTDGCCHFKPAVLLVSNTSAIKTGLMKMTTQPGRIWTTYRLCKTYISNQWSAYVLAWAPRQRRRLAALLQLWVVKQRTQRVDATWNQQ